MCLSKVTTIEPKIAETDIKVFKIVNRNYPNESFQKFPRSTGNEKEVVTKSMSVRIIVIIN